MAGDARPSAISPSSAEVPSGWLPRNWYGALIVALVAPILVVVTLSFQQGDPLKGTPALLIDHTERAVPDGRGGTSWEPVTLPYRCGEGGASSVGMRSCTADLRLVFRRDAADDRLWSVYLPSFQGKVTVTLNGALLASSAWQQSPAELFAIEPMLVPLPSPLLRPSENVLDIAFSKEGLVSGFLDRFAVGPDAVLRPLHDHQSFLVEALPRLMNGWQIAVGLALAIIWIARPRERVFLLFSAMILTHALASLPAILGGAVDPWLVRLAHHGRIFSASLVLPVAWLFVGQRPPVPISFFVAFPSAILVSYLALPIELHAKIVSLVAIPISILIVLSAVVVTIHAAIRNRDAAAMLLCGSIAVALVLAVHDLLALHGILASNATMLGIFGAPAFLAVIGVVLLWRFAQAMNAQDRFSIHLTGAVAAAEEALRRSFAREQAQARARVLEDERMRLMSDLHDGIAGQLVSILALGELRGTGSDEVARAVRNALADLRLVIASLEDSGDDLGIMLAMFRERIEPQLAMFGVTLVWRVEPLPDVANLQPSATLNIFRILQEAAINAARHSGSQVLALEAVPSPNPGHSVRLTVCDHGRGDVAGRPGSHGLVNMRRRAESLGATLSINTDSSGTAVTLDLPISLP